MKTLKVNRLEFSSPYPDTDEISVRLDDLKNLNKIEILNWDAFSYKPDTSFKIAYTGPELLLKFYVTEDYFKAEKTESNQNVFEDSCVEFFVSPGDDGIYYNFEFNGIGTCLMGSGYSRAGRERGAHEIIAQIRRVTSAGKDPVPEKKGSFSWTLTAAIPLTVFYRHQVSELKGKRFRANFYKCGDKLSVPHYVTWNPVGTEKPDFHQPEYFGLLEFV
jgi:hypothetical protein